MTTLYSYTVASDSGFAPNPFHGYCTLACCKPDIRRRAEVEDYVVGLGPKWRGNNIVYAMRITETMGFNAYWHAKRFRAKQPDMRAGGVEALGDNIYRQVRREWRQSWSQHSSEDGGQDKGNTDHDTNGEQVLISDDFIYWGGSGPPLPDNLRGLIVGRAHRSKSNEHLIPAFREWFKRQKKRGCIGWPTEGPPAPAKKTATRRKRC